MAIAHKMFQLAKQLDKFVSIETPELNEQIVVADQVGNSWSGSWLGYHSRVYYKDLQSPPAGAVFSSEWGLEELMGNMGSRGEWRVCTYEEVYDYIIELGGNIDFDGLCELSNSAKSILDEVQSATLSLIYASYGEQLESDKFLRKLVSDIEAISISTQTDFIQALRPSGRLMTRDQLALGEGLKTPPHIAITTRCYAIKDPFSVCKDLRKLVVKLASHIENLEAKAVTDERIGTNIFIGHGRSDEWRKLKDFVSDRLELPWDEFNRVPVAGVTNITRLSQMLDQACIAFLVMTAEDEQADGAAHARMNVIHEVGLFQGRLGFDKAIVLLEEGCSEFTNIQGLGQIRFPVGNISAVFEDIRYLLEERGVLDAGK